MFVAVQDPGEKSQVFAPCPGGVGKENVEIFLAGLPCLVKILAEVYKLIHHQNRPRHEEPKIKKNPHRDTPKRKNLVFRPKELGCRQKSTPKGDVRAI